MTTVATTPQPNKASTPRRKVAAADMLNRVFGQDVLTALRDGFLTGDLTGVVPLLTTATAKPYLRQAAQQAFADVCDAGDADAVALLLEFDGMDGNAVVDPECVRPTVYDDEDFGHAVNDEEHEEGDTVLTRAARRGRSGVVRALVGSGKVDVNRAGPNRGLPLVLAIRSKDAACVEALLSADGIDANAPVSPDYDGGCDANCKDGDTILVRAARVGNVGAMRALVESGKADVNRAAPNGERPLVQAVHSNHAACLEVLLAADGIDASQQDGHGRTALATAAFKGNTAFVQRLLGAGGVAVSHADEGRWTALGLAAVAGHDGCVHALLQVDGVDVTTGAHGGSPLLCTIRMREGGWEACARALASAKGIDINCRHQESGRTALHKVCALKHVALAEHLLIAGGCRFARTTVGHDGEYNRTKAGDTALALAAGDKAVAKVFASGVDYWQRRLHGRHGWAMREAVRTLLLVRQRLDTYALAAPGPVAPRALPYLPEEIWLAALGFLRSADFMPLSL